MCSAQVLDPSSWSGSCLQGGRFPSTLQQLPQPPGPAGRPISVQLCRHRVESVWPWDPSPQPSSVNRQRSLPQEELQSRSVGTCLRAQAASQRKVPSGPANPSCLPLATCSLSDLGHVLSPSWTSLLPGGSGWRSPRPWGSGDF